MCLINQSLQACCLSFSEFMMALTTASLVILSLILMSLSDIIVHTYGAYKYHSNEKDVAKNKIVVALIVEQT